MIIRILLVLAAYLSSFAFASQSEYVHQPYISARVMGMGGAFTAVADDYNALYYNVAGLARLESGELNLGIQAGGTPSIINFYNDIKAAGTSISGMSNVLINNLGSHYSSRVGLGGTLARPSWAIGINPLDLTVEADVTSVAGGAAGLQAYQDTTVQFGKAWNLNGQKTFNIGIAPKVVYRAYVQKDIFAIDLVNSGGSLFSPSDAQEGMTIDADFGMLYTLDAPDEGWWSWMKYAKPTFGFAVRNIFDEGFVNNFHLYSKQSSNILAEGKLDRRFDFGTKFELPEFWVFKPRLAIDERDMGSRYWYFMKGFHVGAELLWKAFGWLKGGYRMGISEGYLTAGISGELGIFLLDLCTYSEEVGTSGATNQSRRYMAKASLDF